MRSIALLIAAILCLLAVVGYANVDVMPADDGADLLAGLTSPNAMVKVLTSDTFDHDTQVTGTMTTGDWFVMFYGEYCGFCRSLKPTWEELAKRYEQHKTSIALVDITQYDDLRRRFDIESLPTLILFRQNKMYRYTDMQHRDLRALEKFITEPIYSVEGQPIPGPLTIVEEITKILTSVRYEDFVDLYDMWPTMFYVCAGMFLISVLGLLFVCISPCLPVAKPSKQQVAAKVTADRKQK